MKKILFSLLFFIALLYSCRNANNTNNQLGLDTTTDMYNVTSDDTGMNIAISKAKNTISQFDQALKSHNPKFTNFSIKKKYEAPGGTGEHMWIANVSFVNGKYKGTIANDSEETKLVKFGDTVLVDKNDITDWMYVDNGILNGGYTIREIRRNLAPQQRKQMDEELGFKIVD